MKYLYIISAALALSDTTRSHSDNFLPPTHPGYITHKYENAKIYLTEVDSYLATSCKKDSNVIDSQDSLLSSSWENAGNFNVYVKSKNYIFIEHVNAKENSTKFICPNSEYTHLTLCEKEFGFVSGNKKDQDYFIGSNEFGIASINDNYPSCNDNTKIISIKRGFDGKKLSIRIIGKDTIN